MNWLVVMNLALVHLAVSLYLFLNTARCWKMYKTQILANGWNEEESNPVKPDVMWSYLVPFANLVSAKGIDAIMIRQTKYRYTPGKMLKVMYNVGPFIFTMVYTQSN